MSEQKSPQKPQQKPPMASLALSPIHLQDYAPPPWLIEQVNLDVEIGQGATCVKARLHCFKNSKVVGVHPLTLNGEALETLSVALDGQVLAADAYVLSATQLVLNNLPERFVLETTVRIYPDQNTQLSGFYASRDGYFTQCEAQGFRRITWFLDRPDVMAIYNVTLHADKTTFPILLANGNPVESGDEPGGRHFASWQDPFKKPSYLFAMVAGKLDVLRDTYRTASGRLVQLAIYVEPGKLDQCAHAMEALRKSMRWDEKTFALECDLDHYMIVAVGDFNMGAMENKGLNIFNTKYVLARSDVATDIDFENIDRVVAHEYFHNWTGNRVTCRDWFQLSLKEGLTVFRDQEFGADTHGRASARIKDVRVLRAAQFPEDAGPMAHPVRPESYFEINNLYTATVYEKGAEVVRMLHTLIGQAAFVRGMDCYFARHDGQAVTCEDFLAAMTAQLPGLADDEAEINFDLFMNWYRYAGTPHVAAKGEYDALNQRYTLTLTQSSAQNLTQNLPQNLSENPAQTAIESPLLLIPVTVGLLAPDGREFDLRMHATPTFATSAIEPTTPILQRTLQRTLQLEQREQRFVFENISEPPTPSLLRNFSAPVILEYAYSEAELVHLLAYDSDLFNRWEAGQRLFAQLILQAAAQHPTTEEAIKTLCHAPIINALRAVLRSVLCNELAPDFIAELLTLPSETTLAEQMAIVDPEALYQARSGLIRHLAKSLQADFSSCLEQLNQALNGALRTPLRQKLNGAGEAVCGAIFSSTMAAQRRLKNICLAYLNELPCAEAGVYREFAQQQFTQANNMSDQFSALSILVNADAALGEQAVQSFYERWQHEALVLDKWLAVQASCCLPSTLKRVEQLLEHRAFDWRNPNKVYALLRTFGLNHRHFHALDGSGYRFLATKIAVLDQLNPQVAARLTRCFDRWKKFDATRGAHAKAALEHLHQQHGLSNDVLEIVGKHLG